MTQTVRAYLEDEYALVRPITESSLVVLRGTCDIFERWLGHEPLIDEPNEKLLSEWVKWLEEVEEYAPRTALRLRADMIGILNDAAEEGRRPFIRKRRVRKPNISPPQPRGWTAAQVVLLIAACRMLPGVLRNGVRRCDYYEGIVRCAWRLVLRRSDLRKMKLTDISPTGRVWTTQKKTRRLTVGHLEPDDIAFLKSFGLEQPFAWGYTQRMFYYWFSKVKAMSGVQGDGSLQRLRVSGATDVARNHGRDAVTKLLGHTTNAADVWYIDETLLEEEVISPSPLAG